MDQEMKDLKERYEILRFALSEVIGRLYEYLEPKMEFPLWLGEVYCEAVDAMLKEGTTEISYDDKKYSMNDLEELAKDLDIY